MTTIVDADALIGLADVNDAHHQTATQLAQTLERHQARVILLPTALAEFATIVADRLGLTQTKQAVHLLVQHYSLYQIDSALSKVAIALYDKQTNKKNTLFDCYVMGTARELGADCIFSFDAGHGKNGFVLIEDFFKSTQP